VNIEDVEKLLSEWGALSKYTAQRKEGTTDAHILERGRAFAPGTRQRAAARLVGRDGFDRRRIMAAGLASCGINIVGTNFVDPIPCNESRHVGPHQSVADSVPPHLRRINAIASDLYRADTLCGLCLRQEYCGYGTQADKAARVGVALGMAIGVRIYREALARAKGWVMGRLTT